MKRPRPPGPSSDAGSERLARLVESVTDDPSIGDYMQRKRELRDRVARADPDAWAIFAADKAAKVRELGPLTASERHESKTRAKLAHYQASLQMLLQVASYTSLVQLLDTELNRLRAPPVTEASNARVVSWATSDA